MAPWAETAQITGGEPSLVHRHFISLRTARGIGSNAASTLVGTRRSSYSGRGLFSSGMALVAAGILVHRSGAGWSWLLLGRFTQRVWCLTQRAPHGVLHPGQPPVQAFGTLYLRQYCHGTTLPRYDDTVKPLMAPVSAALTLPPGVAPWRMERCWCVLNPAFPIALSLLALFRVVDARR